MCQLQKKSGGPILAGPHHFTESVWAALRHKRWLGCQLSHFWHETPVFSLSHTLMLPKQISLQLRGSHEKKPLWKVIHVKQAFSQQSEHQHHRKRKSCSFVRLVSGCTLRQTSPKSQIDFRGCWVLPRLLDSTFFIYYTLKFLQESRKSLWWVCGRFALHQ